MFALAITAYQAYGESVGWVNHLGKPMPRWDDLPPQIQEGWLAAAEAVADVAREDIIIHITRLRHRERP